MHCAHHGFEQVMRLRVYWCSSYILAVERVYFCTQAMYHYIATHCNTLQHTATHCAYMNNPQNTATRYIHVYTFFCTQAMYDFIPVDPPYVYSLGHTIYWRIPSSSVYCCSSLILVFESTSLWKHYYIYIFICIYIRTNHISENALKLRAHSTTSNMWRERIPATNVYSSIDDTLLFFWYPPYIAECFEVESKFFGQQYW